MKKVLTVVLRFFKGVLYFLFLVVHAVICEAIYIVTYEKETKGKITIRKAKRIRRLTKFKIQMWKIFPWFFKFFELDEYMENLCKRLNYGV